MKIRRSGRLSVLFVWLCLIPLAPALADAMDGPEGRPSPPGPEPAPVPGAPVATLPSSGPTSTATPEGAEGAMAAGTPATPSETEGSGSARAAGAGAGRHEIDVTASPEIAEIAQEIEKAFHVVKELLQTKAEEVGGKTASTVLEPELTEALRQWANAVDDRAVRRKELLDRLESLRSSAGFDLLVIVTQEGDALSAPVDPAGAARADAFREEGRRVAEKSLREARASSGAAVFSARARSGDLVERGLYLAAASPIFLRPDAPHSALIGAVSLVSCEDRVRVVLDQNVADLDWHVFSAGGSESPMLIVGPQRGEAPGASLLDELARGGSVSGSVFPDGPPLGHWERLADSEGRFVGGWGINVNRQFLDTLLSATTGAIATGPAPQPAPRADDREAQMKIFFLILAATGGLGLVLVIALALVNVVRRRRADREIPAAGGLPDLPPSIPAGGKDLVSRFEQNWKTFASYTQDLLQESLKEIEQAPHQDVKEIRERVELALEEIVHARKDIARLQRDAPSSSPQDTRVIADALVEIKNQLSIARDEVKNSSNGVVRRLSATLGELGPPKQIRGEVEELLRRVELELLETKQGFGLVNETVLKVAEIVGDRQIHEIERSIEEEVARARAEWDARESEYQRQVEHAGTQMEPLLKDLEEARQNERELRVDLEELTGRHTQLETELEEERSKSEFLTTEREEAWRRERKVVEELREAERRLEEDREKTRALEATLHELEVEVEELREREAELRRELEQRQSSESEIDGQLEELREEEARVRRELEEERRQLLTRIERLSAKNAELERRVGDDPVERERLRDQMGAQARELETLRNAFEALKAEKQNLLDESTRLSQEAAERLEEGDATTQSLRADLVRLRAELASSKAQLNQHISEAALHDKVVAELRGALAAREEELSRCEVELAEQREQLEALQTTGGGADMEQLQKSLIETGRELRQSLQERLALNTQLKEREAVWQSRVNTLELQVTEANRKLSEMQAKLVESDQVIRDLEAQLGTVHETTRADSRTYERILNLKREKEELVRSLERLKSDLGAARNESAQMRQLHGALVEGGVPSAIVACDRKLKVFAWSSAAERIWERTASAVEGRSLAELALTQKDEITALAKAVLRSGRPESIDDLAWSPPDREPRHLRVHSDPIRTPEKGVEGVVIWVDEITAEVEQRMEARLQSLFAESLTESLPAALIVLDGRDRVTTWNQVAARLLGVDADSAIGKELFALATPLAKSVFRRRFLKAKQQGKQKKLRIRMDVKGAPTQCIVTQCPFKSREDTPCGTLLLVEEVGTK